MVDESHDQGVSEPYSQMFHVQANTGYHSEPDNAESRLVRRQLNWAEHSQGPQSRYVAYFEFASEKCLKRFEKLQLSPQ